MDFNKQFRGGNGGADTSTLAVESMQSFRRNATNIILVVGFLSFTVFGLVEYMYYDTIFKNSFNGSVIGVVLAVTMPFILELGRFGFLLASAVDLTNTNGTRKSKGFAMLTIVPTILICAFQTHECWAMVDMWKMDNTMLYCFIFLIYFGFIAECKLISLMYND